MGQGSHGNENQFQLGAVEKMSFTFIHSILSLTLSVASVVVSQGLMDGGQEGQTHVPATAE